MTHFATHDLHCDAPHPNNFRPYVAVNFLHFPCANAGCPKDTLCGRLPVVPLVRLGLTATPLAGRAQFCGSWPHRWITTGPLLWRSSRWSHTDASVSGHSSTRSAQGQRSSPFFPPEMCGSIFAFVRVNLRLRAAQKGKEQTRIPTAAHGGSRWGT